MKASTVTIPLGNAGVSVQKLPTRDRLRLENVEPAGAIEWMGSAMSFARDVEIYGQGESADYLYKVVSGTVRTYNVLVDGRRHVGGFYFAGDIFGLEAGEEHASSAEAVTRCRVLVIKRSSLAARAKTDHEVAFQLSLVTNRELRRLQDHLLLLIQFASERVAAFLLTMADRISARDAVELPMSRRDIADHVGLTIETVSRSLTQIASTGAIELTSTRRIVLHNRSVLTMLSGCSRGLPRQPTVKGERHRASTC